MFVFREARKTLWEGDEFLTRIIEIDARIIKLRTFRNGTRHGQGSRNSSTRRTRGEAPNNTLSSTSKFQLPTQDSDDDAMRRRQTGRRRRHHNTLSQTTTLLASCLAAQQLVPKFVLLCICRIVFCVETNGEPTIGEKELKI